MVCENMYMWKMKIVIIVKFWGFCDFFFEFGAILRMFMEGILVGANAGLTGSVDKTGLTVFAAVARV